MKPHKRTFENKAHSTATYIFQHGTPQYMFYYVPHRWVLQESFVENGVCYHIRTVEDVSEKDPF